MEGGLLPDILIQQRASILKPLAGKDEPLLIRWDIKENDKLIAF